MTRTSTATLLALVTLVAAGVFVGPAAALTTKVTQAQVSPGMQRRVIWSQVQVAQYAVRVSHTGYIHAQIAFAPERDPCAVFIWDPAARRLQNLYEGWRPMGGGRAAVDFFVPDISSAGRAVVDPDGSSGSGDEYLKGDTYDVVAVSYNGAATRFSLSGYTPQTDLHAGDGSDPASDGNVFYTTFRRPSAGWRAIAGARIGGPFDFMPTSAGTVTCDLTWPADVVHRVVWPDLSQGRAPAVWEQYLYVGSAWDAVVADSLTPSGLWWPPRWGSGGDVFWGLSDTVAVAVANTVARPTRVFHYAPALDLVTSDPALGPGAPLKTGVVTMGYRASLTWPANLWVSGAPKRIRRGTTATVRGTFALNGRWATGASVVLRKSVNGIWRRVATVRTDAAGRWTVRVRPSRTTLYQASAKGDGTTGRATETSLAVRIVVR